MDSVLETKNKIKNGLHITRRENFLKDSEYILQCTTIIEEMSSNLFAGIKRSVTKRRDNVHFKSSGFNFKNRYLNIDI